MNPFAALIEKVKPPPGKPGRVHTIMDDSELQYAPANTPGKADRAIDKILVSIRRRPSNRDAIAAELGIATSTAAGKLFDLKEQRFIAPAGSIRSETNHHMLTVYAAVEPWPEGAPK